MQEKISIKGARVHNLKNINLEIPKNKLVVITGLSGSGKSSLAFDTIYAEGQRRYAESLSAYARQFMETRDKPDVDSIVGLSPTIAIDQKVSTHNPRSTVGTVTEIYDYLRLLFARFGEQYCPDCRHRVEMYTAGAISEKVRTLARRSLEVYIYSPLIREGGVDPRTLLERVEKSGYEWVRVDGELLKINDLAQYRFDPKETYRVDLLIGKITDFKKQDPHRLVETALDLSNGLVVVGDEEGERLYSTIGLCPKCGRTMPILDMRSFSFNSPYGACQHCTGLGITMEVDADLVIPNTRLTLAEGAIQPWTRITGNQSWYQKILAAVAERYHFSLHTSISEFPPQILNLILYGTGSEIYEEIDGKKTTFLGVIPDLMARHLETNSEYVRKEIEHYMREKICSVCKGKRLRAESLAVKIGDYNIADMSGMSLDELREILQLKKTTKERLSESEYKSQRRAREAVIREIIPRLINLEKVGLSYLNLDRALATLAGGEVTRVRLATQLSSGLTGVIYILDEPSVGLHPRDNYNLIETLKYLRDLGNTVIVVEHDAIMMKAADWLIDIGPGAGLQGGEVVAAGTIAEMKHAKNSLTAEYLFGKKSVSPAPEPLVQYRADPASELASLVRYGAGSMLSQRNARLPARQVGKYGGVNKEVAAKSLVICGASAHNLKNINVEIPLGQLVCVTGVSGSGKSTLVIDILGKALSKYFYRAKEEPGAHKNIKGLSNIDKVISVDQSPIGRTPRSNPATYTGVFNLIRDLFASLPEARMRGYDAGRFSFNVKGGGRCEACAGEGYIRIPMQFLADVFVECNECGGRRYNQEALEVHYKNKHIADVLRMTVKEARQFFFDLPSIADKLSVLSEVGLGYVELGQPATTLSGGEAQRIKLAQELSRSSTGKTLYILDEPTTGLHFDDIKCLLQVLNQLVNKGNSVIIIEHNLDVIRSADWVIELGPEGGEKGGELIAVGTPFDIAKVKKCWTGKYL